MLGKIEDIKIIGRDLYQLEIRYREDLYCVVCSLTWWEYKPALDSLTRGTRIRVDGLFPRYFKTYIKYYRND